MSATSNYTRKLELECDRLRTRAAQLEAAQKTRPMSEAKHQGSHPICARLKSSGTAIPWRIVDFAAGLWWSMEGGCTYESDEFDVWVPAPSGEAVE